MRIIFDHKQSLIIRKNFLTKIRFISLVSSAGNGVYTASATQLPIMVSKMRNSKGFHSTISRHFFRRGFFKPKQKMARGARSGGGLAPVRRRIKSLVQCINWPPGVALCQKLYFICLLILLNYRTRTNNGRFRIVASPRKLLKVGSLNQIFVQ